MRTSGLARDDLEQALLKAQVKAAVLGGEPNRVRIGRFELVRCLGRGGCGTVYEAFDGAGERVALKLLRAGASWHGARAQHEFRALQRVPHANLVALHELFCDGGRWFFSMELIEGVDLVSYARADLTIDRRQLRGAFVQLLDGLRALHGARKVHRDLKPSNVLVDGSGRTVILDYGLVVDQDAPVDLDRSGPVGTLSYMAPEQLCGAVVGPAADLYAAGRILSEALRTTPAATARTGTREVDRLTALCADLLQREPARRPSATEALARLCGTRGGPRAALHAHEPAGEFFVGRQAQRAALREVLARVQAGETCAAWVQGASGMGKSALLRRFASEARERGALVLEGRCYERENTPFKVFDGVVASLVRELLREEAAALCELLPPLPPALLQLFPELARLPACAGAAAPDPQSDARTQRRAAFDALKLLLARIGERRTLALVIDDLQWGDADSARLLAHLLSPAARPTLALIGGFRSEEKLTSPFLRRLFAPDSDSQLGCAVVDVAVATFTPREAEALASVLHGASRPLAAAHVHDAIRNSRGVPFLLHELLVAEAAGPRAGAAAEELIAARAGGCSRSAQKLLAVLCVAAQPLRLSLAAQATALEASAWASARELCALRLARFRETESELCLEPYHDIVREVIARRVAPDEARRMHFGLARALEELGAEQAELVLSHWLAAGERERARAVLEQAAQQAERAFAWLRAAELYRIGLTLFDCVDQRRRLYERLARVLTYASDHAGAAEAWRAAARSAPAEQSAELERAAAVQLLLAGRSVEGAALVRELLQRAGVPYPSTPAGARRMLARARLRLLVLSPWRRRAAQRGSGAPDLRARSSLLRSACASLYPSDPLTAFALHSYSLAEVRHTGSEYELHALAWEVAQSSVCQGTKGERSVSRTCTALRELARVHTAPYEQGIAQFAEAVHLVFCRERLPEALATLARADALLARCHASHFERGSLEALRIDVLWRLGDRRFKPHALAREAEYLGRDDGYSLKQLQQVVPTLRLMEDRPERALEFLDAHWPGNGRIEDPFDYFALTHRCEALWYAGRSEAAHELLRRHWPALMRHPAHPVFAADRAYLRARSAMALYQSTRRPALRREALRYSAPRRGLSPATGGLLRMVRANLAAIDGRTDEARCVFEEVLAHLVPAQQVTLAWSLRLRLAQLAGDPESLAAARSWFRGFGVQAPDTWIGALLPALPGSPRA
jgi:eukaryotic-like serine/threonine-protein kinase